MRALPAPPSPQSNARPIERTLTRRRQGASDSGNDRTMGRDSEPSTARMHEGVRSPAGGSSPKGRKTRECARVAVEVRKSGVKCQPTPRNRERPRPAKKKCSVARIVSMWDDLSTGARRFSRRHGTPEIHGSGGCKWKGVPRQRAPLILLCHRGCEPHSACVRLSSPGRRSGGRIRGGGCRPCRDRRLAMPPARKCRAPCGPSESRRTPPGC